MCISAGVVIFSIMLSMTFWTILQRLTKLNQKLNMARELLDECASLAA